MYVVGALFWAIGAVFVAARARTNGYSYGWYLAFAIMATPITAAVTLSVAKQIADRRNTSG